MQASHLLHGRLWWYNKRAMYDGATNRYSFEMNGRHVTLVSLTPEKNIWGASEIEEGKDSWKKELV
jgi:hypothetical protein